MSRLRSYAKDRALGKAGELNVIDRLRVLDPTIVKTENCYDTIDFIGETAIIEHKQRSNKSDAFYDTLIGANKALNKGEKPLYFSFGFSDGKVGYIEYTEEAFKDIPVKPFKPSYRSGIVDKEKPHFFIPVEKLTWLE